MAMIYTQTWPACAVIPLCGYGRAFWAQRKRMGVGAENRFSEQHAVVTLITLYSPFISSPVFWPGLACFNSPVYYGGYPLIFLTEYIKFDSYSPNGDSSRIRQVTDFWFSKKARK